LLNDGLAPDGVMLNLTTETTNGGSYE